MSVRSNASAPDKDQISKAFMRSFIELIENFVNEDTQLDAVYRCITALFESMSLDDSSTVLKKILMHFMRKFPNEIEEDVEKSDEYIRKTLKLWQIFGKCSKTMGPVAILERVEDTYAGCWQYYQIYAETLIDEGHTNTDELYKVFKNCMEHCELTNEEVRKIFGQKIMTHVKFPEAGDEDECTIQFMQVRQNNIRKSMAARRRSSLAPTKLHAIFEGQEENAPISSKSTVSSHPPLVSAKSTFANDENLPLSSSTASQPYYNHTTLPMKTIRAETARLSVRDPLRPKSPQPLQNHDSMYHDVQEDTIQIQMANVKAQQRQQHYETTTNDQTSTTLIRKPPSDDFTVFKDPTIAIGQRKSFDANANSPTVCGIHKIPKKSIHPNDPLLTSTPDSLRNPPKASFMP